MRLRGHKALAEFFGVSLRTVTKWRAEGVIDDALIVNHGRILIYDTDKVEECLRRKKQCTDGYARGLYKR